MIDWQKYDPENPPKCGKEYLVTDGRFVDVASFSEFWDDDPPVWCVPDRSPIHESSITHYAPINLPEGEE
ncbi:hypothetical protein D3C77_486760 [compost metagenome]